MSAALAPLHFETPDGLRLTGFVRTAQARQTVPAQPTAQAAERDPPLVFLPGNGFPVEVYAPALAELPPDVAVHGLNPRGMGGSTVPDAFTDWDPLLADLRAYVEQRLTAPVLLGGHSMGAHLALRLAAEAPHLVAGLLLVDPVLRALPGEPWHDADADFDARAFIERARNRREHWASAAEAAAWFPASLGYRHWEPAPLQAFLRHGLRPEADGGLRLATPPWLEAQIYETAPRFELYDWAAAARCAGVIVRGTASPVSNPRALEVLAEALPLGVVLGVRGTHTLPMEHAAATGRALAQGLRLLRGETGLVHDAADGGARNDLKKV